MKADFQQELVREARRLGKQPDELTSSEITALSIKVRSPMEVAIDGSKALASFAATSTGFRTVPLEVYQERKGPKGCGGCSLHGTSADGAIYCKHCGCAGVWMESALKDPNESCRLPKSRKRWDVYVEPRN